MARPIAYRGLKRTVVYATVAHGSPGLDFYEQLSVREKAKMNKLFEWIGNHGWINNDQKFKPIEGTEFLEFKDFQIRMPCYRVGDLIIITHGFKKKSEAISPQEIARATRIRREDQERHKAV
jgi:hypothetical protein